MNKVSREKEIFSCLVVGDSCSTAFMSSEVMLAALQCLERHCRTVNRREYSSLTYFGQQLTLAVFVLFFFLKHLRFFGSILLVGHYEVLKRLKKRFSALNYLQSVACASLYFDWLDEWEQRVDIFCIFKKVYIIKATGQILLICISINIYHLPITGLW